MADNVLLSTVTSGGVSAATDDIGGIQYQRIKITLGDDGTTLGDVSPANPMPVVNSGAAVTVTGSVGVSGPVTVTGTVAATQSGSWGIAGPVTVTGSVSLAGGTTAISGPVTVTGSVSAVGQISIAGSVAVSQHTIQGTVSLVGGTTGISGPVTVTGAVSVAGSVAVSQHTIQGAVSLAGGTTGISGPVTVTGAVSVLGSLSSSLTTLLGATVVSSATVSGTIGVAKRVDTQATVAEAVNTATSLQTDEFGNLRVAAYPGDAQTSNGGGVTGIQVFIGNATTVGTTVPASISGPMTVLGSVSLAGGTTGISGPVTVTGAVSVLGSLSASITNLLGASINANTTVTGTVAIGKRADTITSTTPHTVGGAVPLHLDAFGALWVNNVGTSVATVSGPLTVTGSVSLAGGTTAISGPVTVTGTVSLVGGTTAISGPVTVQGAVSVVGQVTIVGSVTVAQHTINGAVSLAGGTTGISGPVTVQGSVSVVGQVSVAATVAANVFPTATGGLTTFRSMTLSSAAVTVSASAASIYGMWITNTATSTNYIKLYNTTAAQTGSTTPQVTWGIPGNSSDDVGGLWASTHGIPFSNAIMIAATTGISDSASVGAASGDILINLFYK